MAASSLRNAVCESHHLAGALHGVVYSNADAANRPPSRVVIPVLPTSRNNLPVPAMVEVTPTVSGRASLQNRLLGVFSFGGHDDLRRVLEISCTGIEDDALSKGVPAPHDYGVAIVVLDIAERVVPPEQLASLRDAVRRFLWGSCTEFGDGAPGAHWNNAGDGISENHHPEACRQGIEYGTPRAAVRRETADTEMTDPPLLRVFEERFLASGPRHVGQRG